MILVDMPPSSLRNSDPVRVESLMSGTTAHLPGCPQLRRASVTVTTVQAFVHLHAQWCTRCTRRTR